MNAKQRLAYAIFAADLAVFEFGHRRLAGASLNAAKLVYGRNSRVNRKRAAEAADYAFHVGRTVIKTPHFVVGAVYSALALAVDIHSEDACIMANNAFVFAEALERDDLLLKIIRHGMKLLEN